MEHDLQTELQALKTDLASLRTDLKGVVQAVKDMSNRGVEVAKATLEGEAKQLREDFRSAMEETKQRGKDSAQALGKQIEQNPYVSILAAFGLGLILGKLTGR